MKYRILIAAILLSALTGCMSNGMVKPVGATAQWDKDYKVCKYEATSNTHSHPSSYLGMKEIEELSSLCMESKGW